MALAPLRFKPSLKPSKLKLKVYAYSRSDVWTAFANEVIEGAPKGAALQVQGKDIVGILRNVFH